MTIYLDDEAVAARRGTRDAFECVEKAFRLLADGQAVNAVRRRSQAGAAVLNVMWALAPTEGVMGVKSYPIIKTGGTQGAVLTLLVYSIETGELLSVMKADRLGQIRTGAASAVATSAMARADAEVLAVYGTGYQAETQVRALVDVLPRLSSIRMSLEAHMACGLGYCHGCAAPISTGADTEGPLVCVDGPVFDAGSVA